MKYSFGCKESIKWFINTIRPNDDIIKSEVIIKEYEKFKQKFKELTI